MGALYLLSLAATTGCIGWLLKEQHHSALPASVRTPRVRLVELRVYDWEKDQ